MMLSPTDLTAIFLTLKLACVTTLILVLIGTPIAWWLSQYKGRFKFLIEALIALPLVLPPTVIGFYLLLVLSGNSPFSGLAFSFAGLVIGSVIYSLPFVVQPLQNAFTAIGQRPLDVAATLRASSIDRFVSVVLPMSRGGYLTAIALGFAHTVGEFGIVLMIGGNIPEKTQTVSIAIYDHVESMEYAQAHWLAGGMLLLSFIILAVVYGMNRHFRAGAS